MHPVERELTRHAAALRGLARDLVGEYAADDLVQETAMQALRSGPQKPGPLGGWLAGIVRHLAWRHRRTERRRLQREQLAARAEAVPPDREFDDRDAFQRLTAAVLALPEPYQRTVLLRYLREMTPTAIAAQTGVPLATVKTRLQRGLALLRERLDRDGGDTWRPVFCTVLGLGQPLTVGTAAITTTGVMLMGTGAKLAWSGVAVLLALAAWLWSGSGPSAMPPASTPIAQAPVPAIASDSGTRTDGNERSAAAAATATDLPADQRTVVRGRCVDEHDQPLPHCPVELRGRKVLDRGGPDFRRDYGQWLLEHPGQKWRDIAAATDSDGRFEFAFAFVPLGYELMLRRDVLDHVVRIGGLQPGAAKDLGDVVLQVTCVVHGHVADTNGVPASFAEAAISATQAPKDRNHVVEQPGWCIKGPDGTFTKYVVAGDYSVYIHGRDIVRGEKLTVPASTPELDVEVVVPAVVAADTITGVVIDELGQPVEDAEARAGLFAAIARTDASGRFTLCRPRGKTPDQVMVSANKTGWVTKKPQEVNAQWGEHDLRFVLAREPSTDVELRVVCAADGTPVTDYQVWVCPGSSDRRADQHHDDGVARLTSVPAQTRSILVEPDRWDLWTAFVPLSPEAGNLRLELRLPAAAERLLRVQLADGRPATGIAVEQIDPGKAELTLTTTAWPVEIWSNNDLSSVLLMQRSATDGRGELRLRGPADGTIALRLPGPGHAPILVKDVAVSVAEPLVITLSRGARLEGRLGPVAVAHELRMACGLPAEGPAPPQGVPSEAGLRLRRGDGASAEFMPPGSEQPTMVAGDGSFAFDSVPPGTWNVTVARWEADFRFLGSGQFESVATVELREGETTKVAIDLPDWLLGDLEGLVMANDLPMANQEIGLRIRSGADGRGAVRLYMGLENLPRTDAEGRFHLRGHQGFAQVVLGRNALVQRYLLWDLLYPRDEVFLPAGGHATQVFHFDTGKLQLRVLNDSGKPVGDVGLFLRSADGHCHQTPGSDANGRISTEVETQTFTVQVLPRSLQRITFRVQDWHLLGIGADPGAGSWLTLGNVTAKRGETVELEVKLPPEWDR